MKYPKPFLSYEQQADLLLSRGLIADRAELIARIQTVNYYRLSGYLYPHRLPDDMFKVGTNLATVWRQYTFDRRFRLMILDAIERMEIAVRSRLAYLHAQYYGPFGYLDQKNLPGLDPMDHTRLKQELAKDIVQSKEQYILHFRTKYQDSHELPPIWVTVEQMTIGKTVTFYRGCSSSIQREIAAWFNVPDRVMFSWLRTLNEVRNVCAHHGRLWNRDLGNNLLLPNERKYPEWYKPYRVPQDKMFGVLCMLQYELKTVAPTSRWRERLLALLDEYSDIPISWMGFPKNWEEGPLWRK